MIAFIFPGQNSHSVGMGRDLHDGSPRAREVLQAADQAVGGGLLQVMFEGPEEALTATRNQQPAIVAHSVAALTLLRDAGLSPDFVAGHSLGEYSALAAAGVLGFDQVMPLVRYRGEIMGRAGEIAPGAMAAILGLDAGDVAAVVQRAGEEGVCVVANYNCPGQVVISGAVEAVERAEQLAREAGAKRAIRLKVSGAFHSPLMQPAAELLIERLTQVQLRPAQPPVVANADAEPHTEPDQIRDALGRQMTSSVLWEQSVHLMIDRGVDTFVEVGPGTVLSGMVKRISRDVAIRNVGDTASLQQTLEALA